MAIEVRIPSLLRKLTDGAKTVQSRGETMSKLLDNLESQHPGFKERILNAEGGLNQFVAIYVNDEDVRFLGELDAKLKDGDSVSILPAVAGGREVKA